MHGTAEYGRNRLSFLSWPPERELTRDDIVIIAGDFGYVWGGDNTEAYWLKWLEGLYCYAISAGQVSVVVQTDKLSVVVSVAFAHFAFGERLTRRGAAGLALIVLGAAAMAWWA